jgi:hypothetical protein
MPLFEAAILAPPSSTDNAFVRFDGTAGNVAQDSDSTLTDAEAALFPPNTGQLVVGGTPTTFVVAGTTLTPTGIMHSAVAVPALAPNFAMIRAASGATSAPNFNFVRAKGGLGSEAVLVDGDTIGTISAVGFDSVDYAASSQIDMRVDDPTVGSNKMGGQIRFLTAVAGSQNPQIAMAIRNDKSVQIGSPDALTINGAAVAGVLEVDSNTLCVVEHHTHSDTAGSGSSLYGLRSRGTATTPTVVSSGDLIHQIVAAAHDGTDYEIAAQIKMTVGGTPGNNDMPGKIELMVTPDGGVTPVAALTVNADASLSFGGVLNSPTLVTPALGTPASGTLTNCTGLPISLGVSGLGANVATFLGTPSSANLLAAVTDETGTGVLVFGTTPTLTSPVIAAGSASAGTKMKYTLGAVMTTPEAGAVEYDGKVFYASPEASNRGVVGAEYFICLSGTNALTNDTTEQPIFDSVGGGVLTLPTGTYWFESLVSISGLSATSGNAAFDFLAAGTATVGSILYQVMGNDLAVGAAGANISGAMHVTQQTNTNLAAAGTATHIGFYVTGTFRVTGAGTIIPSITFLNNPSAAVVAIGSFFRVRCIGSSSVQTVGQWS